ncbi:hypothetical protein TNCV_1135321 [Trichonephila clavipes]|nr:hypothetical protein TNCV_1135321 [Trichonephila clavipes]
MRNRISLFGSLLFVRIPHLAFLNGRHPAKVEVTEGSSSSGLKSDAINDQLRRETSCISTVEAQSFHVVVVWDFGEQRWPSGYGHGQVTGMAVQPSAAEDPSCTGADTY